MQFEHMGSIGSHKVNTKVPIQVEAKVFWWAVELTGQK